MILPSFSSDEEDGGWDHFVYIDDSPKFAPAAPAPLGGLGSPHGAGGDRRRKMVAALPRRASRGSLPLASRCYASGILVTNPAHAGGPFC